MNSNKEKAQFGEGEGEPRRWAWRASVHDGGYTEADRDAGTGRGSLLRVGSGGGAAARTVTAARPGCLNDDGRRGQAAEGRARHRALLQAGVRAGWWIGLASDAAVLSHVSRRGGLEGWRSRAGHKDSEHLRWFATPLPARRKCGRMAADGNETVVGLSFTAVVLLDEGRR
ncbi:antibiotic biosynthesis monooxygenase [Sesbania bispinosa]|nr:antibiotic biosynthesis monooxygenase [Sesbania bispinosa]